MRLLIFLLTFSSFLFQRKPATNALVILEDTKLRKQIGYQETGEKGKAGFQYLNEGSYRLLIEFPQQEGKWIKEKKKHSTLAKASLTKERELIITREAKVILPLNLRQPGALKAISLNPFFGK